MKQQMKQQSRKRREARRARKTKLAVLIIAIVTVAATAGIILYYTTQLSLALVGDREMTVGLYGIYEDPGVKAKLGGKDVSDKVECTGEVDTSVPGQYILHYKSGTLTVERTVTVLEHMNPEIALAGEETQKIKLGDEYEEPGYTATDEDGNDITAQVKVSNTEFRKAGERTIKYTVSDSKGNTTRVTRTVTVEPNKDYGSPGLPICMYHYVYDEKNPPKGVNANFISIQDLEEELNWLNEEGYYYPTWKEVRDYIDGKQLLPDKSIVLSFDDGAMSFLENGIPVLEKCKVPATCFIITSSSGEEKIAGHQSDYVVYESHSHNMHRPGGNIGHGGIFTAISEKDGLEDLKTSIEICGSSDAFAYPFGDYNDRSRDMLEEAGFLCAVTTQYAKAYPGDDPLLLPRIRMSEGQSLQKFISSVAPKN
ncbi:MAG: DUF5011 domain-containing protein [Bacillota bacterium]|nr:DUF5011 domain-containing protein [Bacillota bacterium]